MIDLSVHNIKGENIGEVSLIEQELIVHLFG
jgi:hypothetical protein